MCDLMGKHNRHVTIVAYGCGLIQTVWFLCRDFWSTDDFKHMWMAVFGSKKSMFGVSGGVPAFFSSKTWVKPLEEEPWQNPRKTTKSGLSGIHHHTEEEMWAGKFIYSMSGRADFVVTWFMTRGWNCKTTTSFSTQQRRPAAKCKIGKGKHSKKEQYGCGD